MTIEEKILSTAVQELSDDIDFEVLTNLLEEMGWHKVVLEPMTWEQGTEVDIWVIQNVKGKYNTRGLVWIFEHEKDANWFKLRWISASA